MSEELRMHPFWRELEEEIPREFRGRIILHFNDGVAKSYEVQHAPKKPSRGHVDLTEDRQRSTPDLTE